jgi:hypothetical protein
MPEWVLAGLWLFRDMTRPHGLRRQQSHPRGVAMVFLSWPMLLFYTLVLAVDLLIRLPG